MKKLQIVIHGIDECSGHCPFCSLCNTTHTVHTSDTLTAIDERTYKHASFDFDKLEQAIITNPNWKDCGRVIIWGGDPLTSFLCTAEVVDFLEYMEQKYDKKLIKSVSTNGIALQRDDVYNWIKQHQIAVQLSHDGTANYMRTPVDPLTFENTQKLIKSNNIQSIYCVQTKYNSDIFEQYKIFDKVPVRRVRFTPVRMTNDSFTITDDIYFLQLFHILLSYTNTGKYNWTALLNQCSEKTRTNCAEFHKGKSNWTEIIDTLGNFCECHLLDSRNHVTCKDIETNKPARCSNCPFNKTYLCNGCGLVPLKEGDDMKDCFYYKLQRTVREAQKYNPLCISHCN